MADGGVRKKMPGVRIELTLPEGNRILNPARLPIPPSGHTIRCSVITTMSLCKYCVTNVPSSAWVQSTVL